MNDDIKIDYSLALYNAVLAGDITEVKNTIEQIDLDAVQTFCGRAAGDFQKYDYIAAAIEVNNLNSLEIIEFFIAQGFNFLTSRTWLEAEKVNAKPAVWRKLLEFAETRQNNFELIYPGESVDEVKRIYLKRKSVYLWRQGLWQAIEKGEVKEIELLYKYTLTAKPELGSAKLLNKAAIYSITKGKLAALKYFLTKGAQIEKTSPALMIAKNHDYQGIIDFLINEYGQTYFLKPGKKRKQITNPEKRFLWALFQSKNREKTADKYIERILTSPTLNTKHYDLPYFIFWAGYEPGFELMRQKKFISSTDYFNFDDYAPESKEFLLKNLETGFDLIELEIKEFPLKMGQFTKILASRHEAPNFIPKRAIFECIKSGNFATIEDIYKYSKNQEILSDDFLKMALLYSCKNGGEIEAVKYFLNKCSHLDLKEKNKYSLIDSCIYFSCRSNNIESFTYLFNLMESDYYKTWKPLGLYYWAIVHNSSEIIKALESLGWKPCALLAEWFIDCESCKTEQKIDCIKYLLSKGWNAKNNNFVLACAVKNKNLDIVKLLLKEGANVHASNDLVFRKAGSLFKRGENIQEMLDVLMDYSRKPASNYKKIFKQEIIDIMEARWQKKQLEQILKYNSQLDLDLKLECEVKLQYEKYVGEGVDIEEEIKEATGGAIGGGSEKMGRNKMKMKI